MFPVFGMATEIPKTRDAIKLSFAPLVSRTGPAVVNIFAKTQRMERAQPHYLRIHSLNSFW